MVSEGVEAAIAIGSVAGLCILYVVISKLADIFFPSSEPRHPKPKISQHLLAKPELEEVVIESAHKAKISKETQRGKGQEFATDIGIFGGNEASQAYVGGANGGYATTNIS
ncbi:hypothetical protein DL89DRAFT_267634 [Linderina pennispora]|uniref:Uncharacterized protein n=1 Tax=Linderina pennispora TaxID=61395 RepID=A0A1Y1W783_9FUNG|nr:uncharacterized protein DL89DRAFT_267634 [Linderina pennispora]ORX69400.1 hypothetical protein DL89DRAFT_267634 [Linderina pennispora]